MPKSNPFGYRTDLHPALRSREGMMSCDEIRAALRELSEDHGWSWTALHLALGSSNRGSLWSKLKNSWIYPREQNRFSRQLARIFAGELVEVSKRPVLADEPVPLRRTGRMKVVDGKLRWWWSKFDTQTQTLPSFRKVFGDERPPRL